MKRFIALLLAAHVAALAPTTQAAVVINSYRFAAGGGPTYLVNQNFEGAGYDNGETWNEGGTPNPNYTGTVLRGSQSIRLQSGDSANATFTAQNNAWAFCDFQLDAGSNANAACGLYLHGSGHDTYMQIDSSGNIYLNAGGSLSSASATQISAATHYYMWLHSPNGGTAELFISITTTRPSVDGSGNVYLSKAAHSGSVDTIYLYNAAGTAGADAIFDHVLVNGSSIGNNP
jgi:hypothetical protein